MPLFKAFLGRMAGIFRTYRPCRPLSHEVYEAIRKKDLVIHLIYETARQSIITR